MVTLEKISTLGVLLLQVAACFPQTSMASDLPSRPLSAVNSGPGWATVTLSDLVKTSKSNCVFVSESLIRCSSRIQVRGLKDVTVQGGDVEVQFSDTAPGKGGIEFDGANNVVLEKLQISWLSGGARDPIVPGAQRIQSFGNVTSCPNRGSGGVLKLDLPLDGTQLMATASVWDDDKGWPWYSGAPHNYEVYFSSGSTAEFSNGQTNCLPQLSKLVGRRVLLRHIISSNPAFLCWGCQNITVSRVRVMSAPGMAFVFGNGGSNFSLIGNVVAPRCAPSCTLPEPSTTADASHFSNVTGNILLKNNDFGWQGDDGLNITGLLIPARRTSSGKANQLDIDSPWRGRLNLMTVGSSVTLFDAGLSTVGKAEVIAVDMANGTLELSSLTEEIGEFIITRTDGIPKNAVIRNNRFHDNRARGILMGASNSLIQGNSIERVTMEAIVMGADTGPWYEGPGAQHVKIQGNTISDVNENPSTVYPSAISAGVSITPGYIGTLGSPIQDITVEGNSLNNVFYGGSRVISMGAGVTNTSSQMFSNQ